MGESGAPVESPSPREIEEDLTPEQQALRRAELNRQRQQRYRDRQRAELSTESVSLRSDEPNTRFTLKLPFRNASHAEEKKPEELQKPLTAKEADEKREKLLYLYREGSKILDDVLEVIVRDHEPICIWQLSEEEASMLVDMQMEQAKKDPAAARVVRKLVAVYDRMFLLMLVGPRIKATGSHIKAHGGVSFK